MITSYRQSTTITLMPTLAQCAENDFELRGVAKLQKNLAPQVGLEPTTLRLTAGCSAIELLRSKIVKM